jgi:glycosyltransferase involved in cell wall biosynthesis
MTQVLVNGSPAISSMDNLPRVILAIRHYYPDGGGAEVLARRLAVRLVQRGLSLTVLTGRYGGRPRAERIDGVPVHRHFIGLYLPVLHELCYLTSLAWELVARRNEYDIAHVFQTQLSAYVTAVICKRLGKKTVVTSHGAGATGDMAVWSSVPAGMRLLRYVCISVDAATGVSKDVMAELHEAGFDPKRTWYVPNGVAVPSLVRSDQSALRRILGLRSKAFIAVFVGRVTSKKVPEFLLDVWTAVLRRYPSCQLVIVGEGEQRAMLEARTRQAGLAGSVVFTGRVENVEDYLRAADIFVLPSSSEGMSIALLEAMAVGLPVVASRVSGTVDVIKHGENGLLFEAGSRTGLTDCIISLIESPNRQTELGSRARTTVEKHFSIDTTVDRYVELYRTVLYGNRCKE